MPWKTGFNPEMLAIFNVASPRVARHLEGRMIQLYEIFIDQLLDPFRIGLLFFLVLTTLRTAQHTGKLVPLGLGVLFVAALLPTSIAGPGLDWSTAVAVGIVSNAVILAVLLAGWSLAGRLRGPGTER